jgi:hypothetical protein
MDFKRRLRTADVLLVDPHRLILECNACGDRWSPNQPSGGRRLHNGYWKCPNGCNSEDIPRIGYRPTLR